jgi:hypothetical protein
MKSFFDPALFEAVIWGAFEGRGGIDFQSRREQAAASRPGL